MCASRCAQEGQPAPAARAVSVYPPYAPAVAACPPRHPPSHDDNPVFRVVSFECPHLSNATPCKVAIQGPLQLCRSEIPRIQELLSHPPAGHVASHHDIGVTGAAVAATYGIVEKRPTLLLVAHFSCF